MQVEKTVFISYRRTNAMTARAVYQHLTSHGYDCFLDVESINSGSFERVILNQIAAKAHFVVILTPSALERCAEPGDWLRREIEYALDNQRDIIPLMFDGFRYSDVQKYLTGKLQVLPQYNSLQIPPAYFEEAMLRLESRFLNKPLDVILRPTSISDQQIVAESKAKIEQHSTVTEARLSAEEWYERGNRRILGDHDGAIADYSEAIRLNPKFVEAFYNRGIDRQAIGDLDGAIEDYTEAIRLNPMYAKAYNNRGGVYHKKKEYDHAIEDYTEAIHLNPKFAEAYNNRGSVRDDKKDYDNAIADYNEAIDLNPEYANAYNNRSYIKAYKGDLVGAIADCDKAIHLNPKNASFYDSRGDMYVTKGEFDKGIDDYERALHIDPNFEPAKINLANARKAKSKQQK